MYVVTCYKDICCCISVMMCIHLESENVPRHCLSNSLYIAKTEGYFTSRGRLVCSLLSYCDGKIYQFVFIGRYSQSGSEMCTLLDVKICKAQSFH